MDDLDRLYYEFVEIMRRDRQSALTDPLSILELHDQIIPYRRIRDGAGLRSNDDYEVALTRLLSGERGYLDGDRVMQDELRAGLEETLPDIRRYRAFSDTRVSLNSALIPPPGHIRYAPPEVRERADLPETSSDEAEEARELGEIKEIEAKEVETEEVEDEQTEAEEIEPVMAELTGPEECPVCSVEIPAQSSYCPYCGARVVPGTCVACGATLDPTWLFCSECGRPRDDRAIDSP
jgi:hypothetical protein